MQHYNDHKGYSLVELMIAITVSTLLIAAASATYIAQNRSFVTQESVAEVNTQSKISHDIVANELRSAGFGWPDNSENDQTILPPNYNFITPVDNSGSPDAVIMYAGLRFVGMLFPQGAGVNSLACPSLPGVRTVDSTDNIALVSPDSNQIDVPVGSILSIDGLKTRRVDNCAMNADGSCNSSDLTLHAPIPDGFPLWDEDGDLMCDRGRPVFVYEDHTYCVDGSADLRRIRNGGDPVACAGGEELAENIQDFQLRYALDANFDGVIDGPNNNGRFDQADFIDSPALSDLPSIRAVRINTLARASREDANLNNQENPPPSIENRNHAQPGDNFRRRWLRSMVRIRNK